MVAASDPNTAAKIQFRGGGDALVVKSGGEVVFEDGASMAGIAARRVARSVWFNLDNGAGTTIDDVLLNLPYAITILAARIMYVDATTGTVAGGNAKIGTTVGGAEIVAATAYENTKAVGTTTAMTIVSGAVPANTPVIVRHTGVAVTQAGQAVVEVEFVPA